MFNEVEDWVMLLLHGSVVGLHGFELSHANALTLTGLIGITYMAISSLEAYHIKKKLKHDRHRH